MTSIIHEAPAHFDAVQQLIVSTFEGSDFGHNGEAEMVATIRNECEDAISLVAIDDVSSKVVGHIIFSPATIDSGGSIVQGMGLGPMAVEPKFQNREIGSKLVREGLKLLKDTDSAFTLVIGFPAYYRRFGFELAENHGVCHGFAGVPKEVFFIHVAEQTDASKLTNGKAFYHLSFGPQHVG
jgi:putative acetyltransferase